MLSSGTRGPRVMWKQEANLLSLQPSAISNCRGRFCYGENTVNFPMLLR